jgi:predicted DNA-binding protein
MKKGNISLCILVLSLLILSSCNFNEMMNKKAPEDNDQTYVENGNNQEVIPSPEKDMPENGNTEDDNTENDNTEKKSAQYVRELIPFTLEHIKTIYLSKKAQDSKVEVNELQLQLIYQSLHWMKVSASKSDKSFPKENDIFIVVETENGTLTYPYDFSLNVIGIPDQS